MRDPRDVDTEWLRLKLESLGVPDAARVATAFAAGDQDELLRALVLREIWVWSIDAWRDQPDYIRGMLDVDAGAALDRVLATGADPDDIGRIARGVAYATTFGVLYAALNLGTSDADGEEVWDLVDDDIDAGNVLWALHESLLSADPSGREGQPPSQTL